MLSRAHRMHRAGDFRSTIRSGARAGSSTLVAHVLPRPDPAAASDPAQPRIGFIVSKAVGSAVVRNRVRRRLRHLCRDAVAGLPAGASVVVRALPPAASASTAQLAADLVSCLQRARRRTGGAGGADGGWTG